MRRLGAVLEKDEDLAAAVPLRLLPSGQYVPIEVIKYLSDPEDNPEVRNLLQGVIERSEPSSPDDSEDREYYERIRSKFRLACADVGISLDD